MCVKLKVNGNCLNCNTDLKNSEDPIKKESAIVDAHAYESTSTDEVPF